MFLIEIIALIFLCRKNGQIALQKGLKPGLWKLYTVLAWIGGELTGCIIGIMMFVQMPITDAKQIPQSDLVAISMIALFAAFGGYLLIRYILENKPGDINDDIKSIGIDDLQPPRKNN
jgi:hypothetical protein